MLQLLDYQQRALDAIQKSIKGSIYIPTGGGKTLVMMEDARQRVLNAKEPMTFVVVAPRILLTEQLCSEFETYLSGLDISYLQVHSGETHHICTTNASMIAEYNDIAIGSHKHHFIFTTYNSLGRVNEADIEIDVVFFDEAHHCVKQSNFVGIAHTSEVASNAYFFTATPKFSNNVQSMNNTDVYGSNIISVPAKEVIAAGCIIPPKVYAYEAQTIRTKENAAFVDSENIIGILNEIDDGLCPKILVAAPSTKVIWDMFTESDLMEQLKEMGYTILHITSKHGAYIDKQKVSREVFFERMNELGADPNKKFIMFHYSIISEGISISGLTHCILLRNLPIIEMCQTIGRVIRIHKKDREAIQSGNMKPGDFDSYCQPFGTIVVPVQNNYGDKIAKQLERVIETVFIRGEVVS